MRARRPEGDLASFMAHAVRQGGVDFHLHSLYSDGAQTPEELLDQALDHGLWAFSLTDHDSLEGVPLIRRALAQRPQARDLIFIPGVECSARFEDQEVHILGYFDQDQPPAMLAYLKGQARDRFRRNEAMMARLRDLGYPIRAEDLLTYGHARTMPGRVHMALWLVDRGYFDSVESAFQALLDEGRPAFVYRERRQVEEVAGVIRQSGGLAVLAHPQQYGWCQDPASPQTAEELVRRFSLFKEAGLIGIECFHGEATKEESALMAREAEALAMICTAGSDSHGRPGRHAPMFRA